MLEKAGKNSGDNRRDNRGLVLRMVAGPGGIWW